MKRDLDLVREILMEVESWDDGSKWRGVSLRGRTKDEVGWHVRIMSDAGLIRAEKFGATGEVFVERLTWDGHEFLESARDDARWEAAKKTVTEKTGALGFDVLKALLSQLVREAVLGGGTP